MQLVNERVEETPPSPPPYVATPTPRMMPSNIDPMAAFRSYRTGMLAGINVLTAVLAVRMIVLVAVVGGIGLTFQALSAPDPLKVIALAVYGSLVVLPSIYLAVTGRG
jgi:hypothetical protein